MNLKKTALYCRVSTDIQREKETISTQVKKLRDYCEREGVDNRQDYIDDGHSGGSLERPALATLLDDVKNNRVSTILVTNTDRLTRSVSDQEYLLETFERYGVRLKAISQGIDTMSGADEYSSDFALDAQGFIAQTERKMIRARVRTAMYQRAKDGKWNGGVVPFGYTTFCLEVKKFIAAGYDEDHARIEARKLCVEEKKLYAYKPEAKIIKLIFSKFLETRSMKLTRDYLHDNGHRTRNGELWARTTLGRILKTPIYTGKMWYGKRKTPRKGKGLLIVPKADWQVTDGLHEAIVDPECYERVQNMLAHKKQNRVRYDTAYLLAGILKCGKCGCGLQGKSTLKKNGRLFAYYRCYTRDQKGNCDVKPVAKERIEETVVEALMGLFSAQSLISMEETAERYNKNLEKSKDPARKKLDSLLKRNQQIDKKKAVLFELVEDGSISRAQFKERLAHLEAEYESNQTLINQTQALVSEANLKVIDIKKLYTLMSSLPTLWQRAKVGQRKQILNQILREVKFTSPEESLQINLNIRVGDFDRTGRDSSLLQA